MVRDAENLLSNGQVLEALYEKPFIKGSILHNNREFKTSCRITDNNHLESLCPCYINKERGLICPHVIALGLLLVSRNTDPNREAKYQEEIRRAARLGNMDESSYIKRVKANEPGAIPAKLILTITPDWQHAFSEGTVPVSCEIEYNAMRYPADQTPKDIPLCFDSKDESILYVIEDISEGPARGTLSLSRADFLNIVRLNKGRHLLCNDGTAIMVNEPGMTTFLRMDLDRENGELIIIAHTELPFLKPGQFPEYLISGRDGWVYGERNLWRIENVLPAPYHQIYKEPVIITRPNVLFFLTRELTELSRHARIESDISLDLFSIEPAKPKFRLVIKGSPASLSTTLFAVYNEIELVACKPDAREHFAIPDTEDLMRYTVRNPQNEKKALYYLRPMGLTGESGDDLTSIVGKREVLNFLGSNIPVLRRLGWKVEIEGRITSFMESVDFIAPVVHINDDAGEGWFDVGFDFEDSNGASISPAEIQTAIRKGDSFIERNNSIMLIDTSAIDSMQDVFSDCDSGESTEAGHFRLSNIYASFVKASLDGIDGIDIEDTATWRTRAQQINRTTSMEPVILDETLEKTLRPYQKNGVNWLRFLEQSGFCGLLADEMGLGKTLQTLAWLQMERINADARQKPALIICPTSLVENWAEEAAKFTPNQKTLILTGPDRKERWSDIATTNIAITSYAILRRDIDQYLEHEFSTVVLDEAQHIKNSSTQNALAAKKVKAFHKLVLTGTPMENSVSDLWSIMDFLMPGYLASHGIFKQNYELPISRGDREGELAQTKLHRKLHPFLLRRLKTDVAKDLPEKIVKIASCTLSPDQRLVYNELLKSSQKKISNMVSSQGFNHCRMEILTILMRLRQICCHLDLLKLPDLAAKQPSAKMDLFFELMDEAMDGGHRILVFSQFVSMLTILRQELEHRNLNYCYLDGSTKSRQEVVHKFNTQRDIPVFLISLKAGGTGLNLTGADMVIHFDPWWNPAVEDQATDRAHRIGQKRTVYNIKMITRNTVEEKVLAMQKKKRAIIDATIVSDEKTIQALSWDDVRELLEL